MGSGISLLLISAQVPWWDKIVGCLAVQHLLFSLGGLLASDTPGAIRKRNSKTFRNSTVWVKRSSIGWKSWAAQDEKVTGTNWINRTLEFWHFFKLLIFQGFIPVCLTELKEHSLFCYRSHCIQVELRFLSLFKSGAWVVFWAGKKYSINILSSS